WERAQPQPTVSGATNLQIAALSPVNDLVTGAAAGANAGANDVDGGTTSIQSPAIALPAGNTLTLSFASYLSHINTATADDFLRVTVVGNTRTVVLNRLGAAANVSAVWTTTTVDISAFAGQTIRILVQAADNAGNSIMEAGIDDVRITRAAAPVTVFSDNFTNDQGWTRNPNGTDTATTGTWERAQPQPTVSGATNLQIAALSPVNDLVRGRGRSQRR